MATSFTRKQLRNFVTNSANFTAQAYTFTLENNTLADAYFAIEGATYHVSESGVFEGDRYKDVFNSASLSNLSNCSVVSGSVNAGFIVNPNTTATFNFTPTSLLNKDLVLFSAPNTLIIDSQSAEYLYGVDLNITP